MAEGCCKGKNKKKNQEFYVEGNDVKCLVGVSNKNNVEGI